MPAVQFGLLRRLFLGILSTSSGSARSISRRAIRKYEGCRGQAEAFGLLCCGVDLLGQAFTFTWVCHS